MNKLYVATALICATGLCVYSLWPSAKPRSSNATPASAAPEKSPAQTDPRLDAVDDAEKAPEAPVPMEWPKEPQATPQAPEEPGPPAPAPLPDSFEDNPYEKEPYGAEAVMHDLEDEFHALTDEIESMDMDHPNREMVTLEIDAVVESLVELMQSAGLSQYDAPNGWSVFRNPDGTFGYGR